MVDGEMESWKNCESEIVESADARWLEKRDSAACFDRPETCLDTLSMDFCKTFLLLPLLVVMEVPLW